MPKKLFNEEEEKYLKENLKGSWARDLAIEFNKKFNRNITTKQLSYWRENHKLKSNVYDAWNEDEIEFLKTIIKENEYFKVIELFKEKFNKDITKNQIIVFKRKYNIRCNNNGRYKKGNIPYKIKPIGTETTVYEKGVKTTYIKVDKNKWKRKQVYIWEQHYGKKPESDVIVFLDGNRDNFDINNLEKITRHESNIMAGNKAYFKDKELNKTSIEIAKLMSKAGDMQ